MESCFTTYFAKVKDLPEDIVPIAICGKSPDWWTGLEYRKLAPRWWFFSKWKETHDNNFYIENFQKEVLDRFDPHETWAKLKEKAGGKTFAMVCYEKPGDFCHRHLVADWFRKAGYSVEEYEYKTSDNMDEAERLF